MMNMTLYKREMKGSIKILLFFAAILTMYITIIIKMYDPQMMESLEQFHNMMPEVMAAAGMKAGSTNLLGFMISYLYGLIMLIFPMVFSILRGNGLIAKYVEKGSMASLLAAPIKRITVAFTQAMVLLSGVIILIVYSTVLEILVIKLIYPSELDLEKIISLNVALLCLQLFIAGICFICSCIFSETKYSIGFGAGIPGLMYILQMLGNVDEKTEIIKKFTFFTLFDAEGIVANEKGAIISAGILVVGAIILFIASMKIFCEKDMSI